MCCTPGWLLKLGLLHSSRLPQLLSDIADTLWGWAALLLNPEGTRDSGRCQVEDKAGAIMSFRRTTAGTRSHTWCNQSLGTTVPEHPAA